MTGNNRPNGYSLRKFEDRLKTLSHEELNAPLDNAPVVVQLQLVQVIEIDVQLRDQVFYLSRQCIN